MKKVLSFLFVLLLIMAPIIPNTAFAALPPPPPHYSVTYNGNGNDSGTVPADTNTYHHNETVTVLGNTGSLVKAGYTFSGWTSASFGGVKNAGNTFSMPNHNTTLYASWTINEYTITFDSDGGTPVADITADYGAVITAPADPTKEGYTFAGWSPELPATMPLDGAALTAQWTPIQYTITFNSDGGTPVADITADYGAALIAPADPTKEGYTFAGWNPGFPAAMPLDGASLTAQWTINQYTITFDSDGGTPVADITADYGAALTAPADPTKEGYTFAGWSPAFPANMPLGGAVITAQWTVVVYYSISYDGNGATGGSVPVDPALYETGDIATAPGNTGSLVKTGFTFYGWNTAADGSGIFYAPGASIPISSASVTLYAAWQKVCAYLADPGVSGGTITKTFVKTKYSYKVTMTEDQSTITFTPVPENSNASVWVNGVLITSAAPSRTFSIDYNHTKVVSIKVRYNGRTHVYTFTVKRAKSTYNQLTSLAAYVNGIVVPFTAETDPGSVVTFDPGINTWYVRVDENTSRVTIKASGDTTKHETVSPKSGTYSVQCGQDRIIKIKAKSQSGITNIYTVHIIRAECSNADLRSLKLSISKSYLVPAFNKDTLGYSITLPAYKGGVTLYIRTDGYKASSIIDNVTAGVSTKKSYMRVNLPRGGSATIEITIKAQDGTTKTYEVIITRNSV